MSKELLFSEVKAAGRFAYREEEEAAGVILAWTSEEGLILLRVDEGKVLAMPFTRHMLPLTDVPEAPEEGTGGYSGWRHLEACDCQYCRPTT